MELQTHHSHENTDNDRRYDGNDGARERKSRDAKDGAVECTLKGEIDLAATFYVFLDANGNYNLDRGEKSIPVEKCAYGPVVLNENGAATIELKYYNK